MHAGLSGRPMPGASSAGRRKRGRMVGKAVMPGASPDGGRKDAAQRQQKRLPSMPEISRAINAVPAAEAKKFFASEMRKDPALLGRFLAVARRLREAQKKIDYGEAVQKRLDRTAGKRGIIDHFTKTVDFSDLLQEARASEKIGDRAEAARLYAEMSEAILRNMSRIDYRIEDRFQGQAKRCIMRIGKYAREARSADDRRVFLAYLLRGWAADIYNQALYEYAGSALGSGTEPDDARYMAGLLNAIKGDTGKRQKAGEDKYAASHLREMRKMLDDHVRGIPRDFSWA